MKSFLKWVLILSTVLLIFVFTVIIVLSSLFDTQPQIPSESYLYIPLSGSLEDFIPPDPFETILGKTQLDMKKIRDNLEKAAVDDRIKGVLLDIGFLQIGYGKLQELHEVIRKYKLSGKKIYAFMESALIKEYYLATACDSIFMPATGNLFLHGINSEITFYKGFFNKLGIEAEFTHVGKYKNAPDTYTRDNMSDPHRKVLQNLINIYYGEVISKISISRNIDRETIVDMVNNTTGFTGEEALAKDLIDKNAFQNEVVSLFTTSGRKLSKLNAATYSLLPASSLKIRNRSNIAVIHVSGTIASGGDSSNPLFGSLSGADRISNNLKNAAESNMVKAIILRIDSPGGSAIAAEVILNAVEKAADKKPVIASIADYGASGGYLIALGADTIIAQPASLIGSIGVFAGKLNIKHLYEKLDLTSERISKGENAGLFSVMQPWTQNEKAVITRLIKAYYSHFVEKVADSRTLSIEQSNEIAQGRVWSGEEGTGNGLIDMTGTIYDAINVAKKEAGIPEEYSIRLSYFPKERSVFEELFALVRARIKNQSIAERQEFKSILQFQNKPLAMMPFRIIWN